MRLLPLVALVAVGYGLVDYHRSRPTLIVLASSEEEALREYAGIADDLPGWNVVAIDLPAHGEDKRPSEAKQPNLALWRARLERGEDVIGDFTRRLSAYVDTLPGERVALLGVSRGAFLGLHVMARDARIDAMVALMPLTQLRVLREFAGSSPTLDRWNVDRLDLGDRPVWMQATADDERVSTAAIAHAAQRLGAELHISGAHGHRYSEDDARAAAAWLLSHR